MDALLRLRPHSLPQAFVAWFERIYPADRESVVPAPTALPATVAYFATTTACAGGDGTCVPVRDRGLVLEVVSPLAQVLSPAADSGAQLTPRERKIAGALYISPTTVAFHRKNLRRKLGLGPRGPRLASHLGQIPA